MKSVSHTHRGPKAARASKPQNDRSKRPAARAGSDARDCAVGWVDAVLRHGRSFDDAMEHYSGSALDPRDRAFARLIAVTVLRRRGTIDAAIGTYLTRPLPEKRGKLSAILQCAAAQLLFLDTPPHAAIALAVDQCRDDSHARRFDKLSNAVLRRVSENKDRLSREVDPAVVDMPAWLRQRWQKNFGAEIASEIASASLTEPALDLTVKSDSGAWAAKIGATILPTGSLRLAHRGRIDAIEGFRDGAWWVQDAAAALPAKLLGKVAGLKVLDLCAAPGGKTAQLAAAGADVTALDISAQRLDRLRENLQRLNLTAHIVVADILDYQPSHLYDAVLLDAPCTATGTIRRHPDILSLRRPEDITQLAAIQQRLFDKAAAFTAPGGVLVYCSCSLEPEEGPDQITHFLNANSTFHREPIGAGESGLDPAWITTEGDLRTLPCHLAHLSSGLTGLDGFYAARLRKASN